jgi:glycosidase
MQWTSNANAGFSIAEPWLPVNKNYQQTNVSAQLQDPSSLLNWYRALIRLRNSEPALQSGSYRKIAAGYGIFCYERAFGTDRIVVALNFSRRNKTLSLPAPDSWHPLLREDLSTTALISGPATLPPYGVLITKASLSHTAIPKV